MVPIGVRVGTRWVLDQFALQFCLGAVVPFFFLSDLAQFTSQVFHNENAILTF